MVPTNGNALNPLDTPLTQLMGVGSERASQLDRLGLRTVGDLLGHRPRRYEDRRHFLNIGSLRRGVAATVRGRIVAQGVKGYSRNRALFEFILEDGTGRLHCRWWNMPFMARYFSVGDEVMVYGKVSEFKPMTMDHPETEVVETGEERLIHLDRIVPIYPLTEGLPQRWLRALVWRVIESFARGISDPWSAPLMKSAGWRRIRLGWLAQQATSSSSPPQPIRPPASDSPGPAPAKPRFLPALDVAYRWLHFPETLDRPELARQRLAMEELIDLQVRMRRRRLRLQAAAPLAVCQGDNHLIRPFLARLGFTLTPAQTAVLKEIRRDLGGPHPMRRLLQGDVGSGKTVVAACSVLMALESGCNATLMAPTEILAEQHFKLFSRWFTPLGLQVELHTGSTKTPKIVSPAGPTLAIGTHALIEPRFSLDRLGLVVIDEQHKFGVAQREALLRKGRYPHLLVMTATPIPRTLGLTLYGDLDISVIVQPPPGRGALRTFIRGPDDLPRVNTFIKSKIAEGRQVYIILPRVEESDLARGIRAVKEEFARLSGEFAPARVGLLHGRLRPEEKERAMEDFRRNQVQILLATTVVEVGVDVPNATVMLIYNAEQYGLAQLHQLRGRIGRGPCQSFCILLTSSGAPEERQRLAILEQTNDGFRIAEEDLRLRGPGELLGRDQSGLPEFRFANLATDSCLVECARSIAVHLVSSAEALPCPGPAGRPRRRCV